MAEDYRISPVGDSALSVVFGSAISPEINGRVQALKQALIRAAVPGITDMNPTYCALLVSYDPLTVSYASLAGTVKALAGDLGTAGAAESRVFLIPVCYGGEFGEDLSDVARHTGLTEEEVIRRHSAPDYLIYMLGFLPGFSYLGGMDPALTTPRLQTPRTVIPAGSVGIGGAQTGIYPIDSPGGWRLIGRTPVRPYDPRTEKILYHAGDYIRFTPVDEKEYREIERQVREGSYVCPEERKAP